MTPYEKLTGTKPDLSVCVLLVIEFGCTTRRNRNWTAVRVLVVGLVLIRRQVLIACTGRTSTLLPVERSVRFEPVNAGLEGELDAGVSRPA